MQAAERAPAAVERHRALHEVGFEAMSCENRNTKATGEEAALILYHCWNEPKRALERQWFECHMRPIRIERDSKKPPPGARLEVSL